jgi:copper chaperone
VNEEMTYRVPGMTCAHCKEAVGGSLSSVSGVTAVDIDLDTKRVTVTGEGLDDADLRRAISDAGTMPPDRRHEGPAFAGPSCSQLASRLASGVPEDEEAVVAVGAGEQALAL